MECILQGIRQFISADMYKNLNSEGKGPKHEYLIL